MAVDEQQLRGTIDSLAHPSSLLAATDTAVRPSRFAGRAVHDPVGALLLCASATTSHTVVNGRVVVRDGRLTTVDLGPLVERHNRLAMDLAAAVP